jgi:hypothetical protein
MMVVETFIYFDDEDRRHPSRRISFLVIGEQVNSLGLLCV